MGGRLTDGATGDAGTQACGACCVGQLVVCRDEPRAEWRSLSWAWRLGAQPVGCEAVVACHGARRIRRLLRAGAVADSESLPRPRGSARAVRLSR